MKKVLQQEPSVFETVKVAVERNAFFAFSDNVLGCMLADPDQAVREQAVNTISKIRETRGAFDINRTVPELNWGAELGPS